MLLGVSSVCIFCEAVILSPPQAGKGPYDC